MVTATRSNKMVPPSALAAKMFKFSKATTINPYFSGWITHAGDRIYVRKGVDKRFHLATWQLKKKGQGHATRILEYFEKLVKMEEFPYKGLKVESVINERFADFFRERGGWLEVNDLSPVSTFVFDA
jgi:hypothetical protein